MTHAPLFLHRTCAGCRCWRIGGLASSRFIAFGLPAGQDEKRTVRLSRPVLLYSRSTALELLLSIALREASVGQSGFYHPLFVHDENGLLFNNKVVPF